MTKEGARREKHISSSHSFLINAKLTQHLSTNKDREIVDKNRWGNREHRDGIEGEGLWEGGRE
jgi:hypothetical protein